MEKQQHLLLKQAGRKNDKTEEHESKSHTNKSVKKHKEIVNGKEHVEGSGTMTFSYKKLQVPKELIKKAKKLVETTTGLNNTFIQFIQQASEEQGDKSIRHRHLKAFKAVLADLKKAHTALEVALEPEFRNMDLQNGNEEQHIVRKTPDVVATVENDHKENVVVAADEVDACEEPEEEQHKDNEVAHDQISNDTEMKDFQTGTDVPENIVKTEVCDDEPISAGEVSLDHDIMSVPPSVPEELFQMVESLADSTILSQTDNNSAADTDIDSNENSTDAQQPKPKVKNLIVKLTPVPVVKTCGPRTSRSSNREKDGELHKTSKEESMDDKTDNTVGGLDTPPPSRRSSRVKTTPLRKQTDIKGEVETSESESEEDNKNKAKSSDTKKDNGNKTKVSETKTVDSDSDEVPQALLEKAAEDHSTDEEQRNPRAKKHLFKLNNTSKQNTDKASKRKRKSETSDSDLENKSKKTLKKKKQQGSDSSNSDSEQEESMSKTGTAKRRSGRVKKHDEPKERGQNSSERKGNERKRSYEKKRKGRSSKAAAKLDSSSSEHEEEEEREKADSGSGEDSDEQKIKPIVEDNMVEGRRHFHQSSGKLA